MSKVDVERILEDNEGQLYYILGKRLRKEGIEYTYKNNLKSRIEIDSTPITVSLVITKTLLNDTDVTSAIKVTNTDTLDYKVFYVDYEAVLKGNDEALDYTIYMIGRQTNKNPIEKFHEIRETLGLKVNLTDRWDLLGLYYILDNSVIECMWGSEDGKIGIVKLLGTDDIHVKVQRDKFTYHESYSLSLRDSQFIIDDINRVLKVLQVAYTSYTLPNL